MIIKSSTKQYSVDIYDDFSPVYDLNISNREYVVIDKKLYDLYRDTLFGCFPVKQVYLIDATEENKTIETALDICGKMTTLSAKKNAHLISFGGGIVQDITGFVANILYRGIEWTFFPTTLLAGCDSCIGGKTSLNYDRYKNLLGTFYPPNRIEVCVPFFSTLSERDYLSGLGEVVKFNVIRGESGISSMESHMGELLNRDAECLMRFVKSSLEFKKIYIERDEFDQGIRIHLNYAHTFGHAFETTSKYEIPHGTAVAMGTIVANRISLIRGWVNSHTVERIEAVLLPIIKIDPRVLDMDMKSILAAIRKDKKQIDDSITAVLVSNDDMSLVVVHDVTVNEIEESIGYLMEIIKNEMQSI